MVFDGRLRQPGEVAAPLSTRKDRTLSRAWEQNALAGCFRVMSETGEDSGMTNAANANDEKLPAIDKFLAGLTSNDVEKMPLARKCRAPTTSC
jgi:hypothetical protein